MRLPTLLAHATHWEELIFNDDNFSAINGNDWDGALSNRSNLRKLGFVQCQIGPAGCNALARYLRGQNSNNLRFLDISGNAISETPLLRLADSLANNTHLQTLWAQDDDMMDARTAGGFILLLLRSNSRLTELRLPYHVERVLGEQIRTLVWMNRRFIGMPVSNPQEEAEEEEPEREAPHRFLLVFITVGNILVLLLSYCFGQTKGTP